ncbi:MAG: DAK2 domain-containing protein, partial [Oscillospiraceae bacterium]|nr:DAK2 domain-containing protein [Oscillospiraceae bacterium]
MKEMINGLQFGEMILCAYEALEANKQLINDLNVFPVPDGDTGTNMCLTMSAAANEFKKAKYESLSDATNKAASALLRGARGNSGVILSLLFRGLAKSVKGLESADAQEFAQAMRAGVDAAYKAVMKPAEGTILTVSRVGTTAAVDLAKCEESIELVLACALAAAKDALEETIENNPVLKRAGVVDAGGKGYVTILDAMLASLQGRMVSGSVEIASGDDAEEEDHGSAPFGEFDTAEIEFAYDTVYIVRKLQEEIDLDPYRAFLESIGDSLVISEDDEVFKVHVHTNVPGDALNEAAKYGVLELAKIENMRTQHDELVASKEKAAEPSEPEYAPAEKEFGFVSVCAGEGLAQLFREIGVDRVVTGGQTMNPSTEDILREINRTPAETVFVFPNNKNIWMAAQQCEDLTDKKVVVIPTRTVPQGITAMLNMDPGADEATLTETFNEVIGGVHTALVTYAARDSEFDGHSIKAGEYLALMDGALLGSFDTMLATMEKLNSALEEFDPEFISVYYGEDVSEAGLMNASFVIYESEYDVEVLSADDVRAQKLTFAKAPT